MQTRTAALAAIVTVALLAAFAVGMIIPLSSVQPVAPVVRPQAASGASLRTINTAVITTTTNFDGIDWAGEGYTGADVFYSIDQTDVNTLTLTLQVSPDNVTWVDHAASSAVLSANVADANGYIAASVNLRYFRLKATCGNTSQVTPTLKVFLR